VKIDGANLSDVTEVTFDGVSARFKILSAVQIGARVPYGALTGPVVATSPEGTATSPTNFRVKPTLTSFTPTSGPVGTLVTITGSAFTTPAKILFDGYTAWGNYAVDSYTQIRVLVPLQATTGPITVITAGGRGISAISFTVTP